MPKLASLRPTKLANLERERQWVVNVPKALSPTGKRQRLFFATKLEAEIECDRLKTKQVNFGHSLSSLSAARIAEASACFARLDTNAPGVSLTDAVTSFLNQHRIRTKSVTMATMFASFLDSKRGASPEYFGELRTVFHRLEPLAPLLVSDITGSRLEETLVEFPPTYRNAALRYLRATFNHGIRNGWTGENPVSRMEFTKVVRGDVTVIPPATVEKLLADAFANDMPLVPFLTLAFYAGIRPDGELSKLLWSDIELGAKEHHVTIRAAIAKKRKKRWIDMSPNALSWLYEFQRLGGKTEGLVVPFSASTLRRKRRRNYRAAGMFSWPQQGARHSYCSFTLARDGDINRLVLQAGHESPTVMWNRYYKACTPADAAAFWNIFPPAEKERKVIAFAV
jgi:integrase